MNRFPEAILHQPIESLPLSPAFKGVTEILGFHTLADLLLHHTSHLESLPGMSVGLIHEYIHFIEDQHLGKYIDPF